MRPCPRPSVYGCRRSPCLSVSQFSCPLAEERGTPGAVPAAPFLEHLQAGSQQGQGVDGLICPRINTAPDPPLPERWPGSKLRCLSVIYRGLDEAATGTGGTAE
ncbi:hypothetical protein NDU88_009287 [Pleurodeles waltl]|uniref:Uncharacterized protein n=1 Tax=Pleurodeles waltl TaxID=8319 RepID=A0AAV7PRS8_PLEWA|nr:hypothetical protein NDU88_009287 [Pleurodeles waltl]